MKDLQINIEDDHIAIRSPEAGATINKVANTIEDIFKRIDFENPVLVFNGIRIPLHSSITSDEIVEEYFRKIQ